MTTISLDEPNCLQIGLPGSPWAPQSAPAVRRPFKIVSNIMSLLCSKPFIDVISFRVKTKSSDPKSLPGLTLILLPLPPHHALRLHRPPSQLRQARPRFRLVFALPVLPSHSLQVLDQSNPLLLHCVTHNSNILQSSLPPSLSVYLHSMSTLGTPNIHLFMSSLSPPSAHCLALSLSFLCSLHCWLDERAQAKGYTNRFAATAPSWVILIP